MAQQCQGHIAGTDESGQQDSGKPRPIDSRKRRQLINTSLGKFKTPSERGVELSNDWTFSTSGSEPSTRSGIDKNELSTKGGTKTSGKEQASDGAKTELAPAGRSRSSDRRMSMSILDTVFRRRRRQSLATNLQESSDSEVSTDQSLNTAHNPASTASSQTWKSNTCRQLNEETGTTSSTEEKDEVDHHTKLVGSPWHHKVRRRMYFNKANSRGT